MKQIFAKAALVLLALAVPVGAAPQPTLAGEWAQPHGSSVVVKSPPAATRYCGTISWASAHNREKGDSAGHARAHRPPSRLGGGVYKGSAYRAQARHRTARRRSARRART